METILSNELLNEVLGEINKDLARNNISGKHRAQLHHQLGTIYGLLGNEEKQRESWQEALRLDPQNQIFLASLKKTR